MIINLHAFCNDRFKIHVLKLPAQLALALARRLQY
jgi:hypothetical protein